MEIKKLGYLITNNKLFNKLHQKEKRNKNNLYKSRKRNLNK